MYVECLVGTQEVITLIHCCSKQSHKAGLSIHDEKTEAYKSDVIYPRSQADKWQSQNLKSYLFDSKVQTFPSTA